MRSTRLRASVICALALFCGGLAPAAAQTGEGGEITGKVLDAQGGTLPGVNITLSGPALMGTRTTVTTESGQYRFPGVTTGTYELRFDLAGFASFVREGIIVPARVTVTIDAEMTLATLAETVTVSGASPVVDLENTKLGSRLDSEMLAALPTSKSLWGTATLAPGVVMGVQDPSGRDAFTKNTMIAHGALNYAANYFGITAETAINTGSMYYLDMEATDELSVDTAAMDAAYGGTGGLNINIIPKSGGNRPSGAMSFSRTGKGMMGDNLTDELRSLGVTLPSLQTLRDFHISFGGPIKQDKVWYFGSAQEFTTFSNSVGFPLPIRQGLRNYVGRLTYQVGKSGRLGGVYYYDKKMGENNGGGISTPDPITTSLQRSPKNLFVGNYNSVMSQNTFLDASIGHFDLKNPAGYSKQWDALPLEEKLKLTRVTNTTTGVNTGPTGGSLEQDSDRFEMKMALSFYRDGWLGANHQLKTGANTWLGYGKNGYSVWKDATFQVRNDANGVPQPVQFDAYQGPVRKNNRLYSYSAFIDDRLTYSRATLNLGVRFTHYSGSIGEEVGLASTFFPEITTAPVDVPINWNTVLPRTGFVLKLTEDGRNVVKASYGRYAEWLYTTTFANIDPMQTRSLATYRWFGDRNGNALVDPAEFDPNPISVFRPPSNSIDPGLKDPKVDEITFGYEREVAANVGFSVTWVQRWFTDNYADVNVGIPESAYVPRAFSDPGPDNIVNTGDDRPITLYDVSPAYLGKDVFRKMTVPGTARHRGLDIAVSKRLTSRWSLNGSYVWSRDDGIMMGRAIGTGAEVRQVADPNNPNAALNNTGRQSGIDQPHAFKLTGAYRAPFDITIGTIYQALTGLTRDRTFQAALTQGTTTVLAEPRGAYRNDFLNIMSVNAQKKVRFGRAAASLNVEVHNVLNTHAAQDGFGTLTRAFASQAAFDAAKAGTGSFFGRRTTVLDPRLLKINVKLEF